MGKFLVEKEACREKSLSGKDAIKNETEAEKRNRRRNVAVKTKMQQKCNKNATEERIAMHGSVCFFDKTQQKKVYAECIVEGMDYGKSKSNGQKPNRPAS